MNKTNNSINQVYTDLKNIENSILGIWLSNVFLDELYKSSCIGDAIGKCGSTYFCYIFYKVNDRIALLMNDFHEGNTDTLKSYIITSDNTFELFFDSGLKIKLKNTLSQNYHSESEVLKDSVCFVNAYNENLDDTEKVFKILHNIIIEKFFIGNYFDQYQRKIEISKDLITIGNKKYTFQLMFDYDFVFFYGDKLEYYLNDKFNLFVMNEYPQKFITKGFVKTGFNGYLIKANNNREIQMIEFKDNNKNSININKNRLILKKQK